MSRRENTIGKMSGNYEGSGTGTIRWKIDELQRSFRPIGQRADGFEMEFKHDFDDGPLPTRAPGNEWIAPFIFRLESFDSDRKRAIALIEYCDYHMKIGETSSSCP